MELDAVETDAALKLGHTLLYKLISNLNQGGREGESEREGENSERKR